MSTEPLVRPENARQVREPAEAVPEVGSTRRLSQVMGFVRKVPVLALVGMIRAYQSVISPMTGPTCKYYPSCSQYALTAVRRHGALRGTGLALWRLLRCNPWSLGGVDDVPSARHPH